MAITIVDMPQNVRTMTLTLTGETRINFANDYNSIAIRAENACGISEFPDKQIGDNGVLKCNAGESIIYPNLISKRYIYLIGTGKVELLVGNNLNVNPFKNGGKGGEKPLNYLGVTTTALSDGATTNPIMIDGESVTAKKDDYVTYNSKDFIFNGTTWHEVGDLENYYTKSETDTLLSAKANTADVYTKYAVDTLLSAKANITDVYLKSDFIMNDTVTQQEITDSINNIWS